MRVPMCFGRASLVSQKSGLDPGKLLAGHTSPDRRTMLKHHMQHPLSAPIRNRQHTVQDVVWEGSPAYGARC